MSLKIQKMSAIFIASNRLNASLVNREKVTFILNTHENMKLCFVILEVLKIPMPVVKST